MAADCYTAKSGSTVITLKAEYLETLAAGKHTLTVLYTDGEETGTFTIAETSADGTKSPSTGDNRKLALWASFAVASGIAVAALTVGRQKKKYDQ